MATAEEQVRLLTDDNGLGIDQILELQTEQLAEQTRVNQQLAQSEQLQAPRAADTKAQQEAQARAVDIDRRAGTLLNARIEQLGLDENEARLVRIDGTLDKALQRFLTVEEQKVNGNSEFELDQREVLARARQLLQADYEQFVAATDQEQVSIVRPEQNPLGDAELDELLQGDEPVADFIGRTLGVGLGGLIGLAAIPATLVNESAGQVLGSAAQATRDAFDNPDIASVAAERQLGEVIARTQLPEGDPNRLTIGQAVVEGARQGADADFILDTLAGTVGALAGGGALGGAARGVASVAARAGAPSVAQGAQRVAQANQSLSRATAGAPAVGVGIGAGVDGEINRPEATALAGTVGASSLFGRFGPLGTVESTVAGRGATQARQSVVGGAARVGAGEAAQEFIEGAGESFAGRAGDLGSLGAAADQGFSQDIATGAVAAPLGAALGANFGAGGAVVNNVGVARQEQAQAAETERLQQEQEAVAQAQQTPSEQSAQSLQEQEAINELRAGLNQVLPSQQRQPIVTAADPNARLDDLNQPVETVDTVGTQLQRFFPQDNPQILTESLVQARQNPRILRALVRNDVPDGLHNSEAYQAVEDSLVENMLTAQTVGDAQSAVRSAQAGILSLTGEPFGVEGSDVDVDLGTRTQPIPGFRVEGADNIDLGTRTQPIPGFRVEGSDPIDLGVRAQSQPGFRVEGAPNIDVGQGSNFEVSNAPNIDVGTVDTLAETESTVDPVPIERDIGPDNYVNLRADNPVLEGLTAAQRRELKNSGFQRNKDAKTIKTLLNKETLTEAEQTRLSQAIEKQRERINRKKPQPLDAEGTPTSRPATPRQPGSARPAPLVRPERLPSPQGEGQVVQSFTGDVSQSVASLTQNWTPKARNSVKVITSDDPVLGEFGVDPRTSAGFTDGKTAYIIADSITSEEQLSSVLGEEIFHRGFMVANGGNYNAVLDNIYKKRNGADGLLQLARQFNAGSTLEQTYQDLIAQAQAGDKEAQRELTDEVLATIATQPNLPPQAVSDVRRITTKLRGYVRRLLGQQAAEAMSDEEILKLVREANAAGRTGEGSSVNVVRRNRIAGDEYLGRDSNGNTVYRTVSQQFRQSTQTQDDVYAKVARFIQGTRNLSPQELRGSDLGGKFLNSGYKSVVRRIANASNKLALISREGNLAPQGTSDTIVQEITDNIPAIAQQPLLRSILQRYSNPQAARDVIDIEGTHSLYSSQAATRMTNEQLQAGDTMMDRIRESQRSLTALAAHLGEPEMEVRNTLMRDMQGRHTRERNDISFLKGVELQGATRKIRQERKDLAQRMEDGLLDQAGMARLREIVEQHKAQEIDTWRKGTGMTNAEADAVVAQIASDYSDPTSAQLFESARQAYRKIMDGTNEVRDAQGAMSANQKAAIALYNWQHYIPMHGQGVDAEEEFGFAPKFSEDVYAQTFRAFEGKEHITNDTIGVIYRNAIIAYENSQAQETFIDSVLMHTAGNALSPTYRETFQRDGTGADLLAGSIREFNPNSPAFAREMATKDPRTLVRYNSDNARLPKEQQSAIVIKLNDSEAADAVFSKRSEGADTLDRYLRMTSKLNPFGDGGIHELTRFMASLKTTRNPVFIPFDGLRNILTFGYDVASNEGLGAWRDFMGQYLNPQRNFPVWKYVQLRTQGKFNELQQMVQAAGPNSELAQLDEFFKLGGPSNPIQALQDRGTGSIRDQAAGIIDPDNLSNLQKADQLFQIANQGVDLLARFGMYQTLLRQGQTPQQAASRAKNLVNFERRGTWAGPGSALFEFFNATAIGGTALVHSTLTGRYGAQTLGAAVGAGFGTYMLLNALAGKDDEGEDRMGQINGRLFTNNLVFQYGDEKDERLQFGFGFGPVASSLSTGIQLARLALGHQNTKDTISNATGSFTAQANVLPLSGISPADSPLGFAFDTAVPSIVKPFFQLMTNMSSLGMPVYSDWAGDWFGEGASLEGRIGSEGELYEETAQQLRKVGLDINPDALRHLGRSYLGGLAGLSESAFEQLQYARGQTEGEVNLKNAFYLPRQFFGSTYAQLDQDFYTQFQRLQSIDDRVKKLTDRQLTDEARALAESPVYRRNFGLYQQVNRELTALNRQFNEAIRAENQDTNARRALRQARDDARSRVMRQFLDRFQE